MHEAAQEALDGTKLPASQASAATRPKLALGAGPKANSPSPPKAMPSSSSTVAQPKRTSASRATPPPSSAAQQKPTSGAQPQSFAVQPRPAGGSTNSLYRPPLRPQNQIAP